MTRIRVALFATTCICAALLGMHMYAASGLPGTPARLDDLVMIVAAAGCYECQATEACESNRPPGVACVVDGSGCHADAAGDPCGACTGGTHVTCSAQDVDGKVCEENYDTDCCTPPTTCVTAQVNGVGTCSCQGVAGNNGIGILITCTNTNNACPGSGGP